MRKRIFTLILLCCTLTFADRIVIDTSMATSTDNDYKEFEDRGSFGPYVEFNNVKMKNVDYSYRVNGRRHDINIDNTYIYGASGSLPLTEWFDIYLMAGYQYLGVSTSRATGSRLSRTSPPMTTKTTSSTHPSILPTWKAATKSTRLFSSWVSTSHFPS